MMFLIFLRRAILIIGAASILRVKGMGYNEAWHKAFQDRFALFSFLIKILYKFEPKKLHNKGEAVKKKSFFQFEFEF